MEQELESAKKPSSLGAGQFLRSRKASQRALPTCRICNSRAKNFDQIYVCLQEYKKLMKTNFLTTFSKSVNKFQDEILKQ